MQHTITEEAELHALVAALPTRFTLLADCEFVRERTFWPKLGLLQLRIDHQILLLDPVALKSSAALQALFARSESTVMHSASEDLECLLHAFEWLPPILFDTQIAAAFCGLGPGLSYRALVERYCGVVLDKAETRSDWLARPLSAAQLRYAAEDVEYLPEIHAQLSAQLDRRGMRAWFESDCAALVQRCRDGAGEPGPVLLDARATSRLDARATARLQRIFDWREREARRLDRPRGWIVDNESAYLLAAAPSGDADAHRRAFERTKNLAKHAPAALWDELAALGEPVAVAAHRRDSPDSASTRSAISAMQQCVAQHAERLDLPPGLLLPRKHIEHLVETGAWPDGARGWREALLADPLRALLPR